MTMTSLWRNVSVNVAANTNWSFLKLISAPKVHWRVQPTAARRSGRFNKMRGTLHALHVSQQCLHENCLQMIWLKRNNGHLITLQIWKHRDIMSGERRTKLFWNFHPKPKTVSELKVSLEKLWDNFPQVQLIKLSRIGLLQVVWQEYVNCDGRQSNHLSMLKSVRTYGPCAVLNSWNNFLMTSQLLSCHDYKQRNFINSVDNVMKLSPFTDNWMDNQRIKFLYHTSL